MASVTTLIAAADTLSAALVARAAAAVDGTPDWLAVGTACDIAADLSPEEAEARIAADLEGLAVDIVAQEPRERRKALLVADMESTIIENEMIDDLAVLLGFGERIAAVTARAMAGEISFDAALEERVALLAGCDESILDRAESAIRITLGATSLVATMRAAGALCALVSGGFDRFAGPVSRRLGFDCVEANRLEMQDGRLTGCVIPPVLDGEAKRTALLRFAAQQGIDPQAAIAVGDGANDADMLRAAGMGVAFRGKEPAVAAAAANIVHGDLTALLYIQGYRQEEIRAGEIGSTSC